MIDKINNKINEELEKILNKEDLSLEDLRFLTEIKSTMEISEKFKNTDFLQQTMSDEVVCSVR